MISRTIITCLHWFTFSY